MVSRVLSTLGLLALVAGCAPTEDRTWERGTEILIDTGFDPATQEATIAAVDQWNRATRGALDLTVVVGQVSDARPSVFPDASYAVYGRTWMSAELPPRINLDIPAIIEDAPGNVSQATLLVTLHEVGHALGLPHTETGIMAETGLDQPPCLELQAVALLCDRIGCPSGFEATCSD